MKVIEFSGGRDSRAVLELLWPRREEFTVLIVDTGGWLPELAEFVEESVKGWPRVVRVRTDAGKWIEQWGIPADLVPSWAFRGSREATGEAYPYAVVPARHCCIQNLMEPLHQAALALGQAEGQPVTGAGAELTIYRGVRGDDPRKSCILPGEVHGGVRYEYPIWDWDAGRVNAYLAAAGVRLPAWYELGGKGLDCWWCTGYTEESDGVWRYLAREHPEKWAVVRDRLMFLAGETVKGFEHLRKGLTDGTV